MQLGELLNLGESPNFCLAAVMARASYGQQTKKRAKCLLAALLAYANDALDESYEEKLNVLRSQIQVRWLTEKRLVVRTKVRFLQELTGLSSPETPVISCSLNYFLLNGQGRREQGAGGERVSGFLHRCRKYN